MTATTVGYGDIAPTSTLGRVIAVVLMLCGIGLMSTLAASITTYFITPTVEEKQDLKERREIAARLERIEVLLESVLAAQEKQEQKHHEIER